MKLFFDIAYAEVPLVSNALDPLNTDPLPTMPEFFGNIFPILIEIAAGLAILYIAYWGLMYILSNVAGIKQIGKERIWGALWGLLLALSAWLILNIINPDIITTLDTFVNKTK